MSSIEDFRARLDGVCSDGKGGLTAFYPCPDDRDRA